MDLVKKIEYGRIKDVKCHDGELNVVIEATSISENLPENAHNPVYPLSLQQLKRIETEYGIRILWDGSESSLDSIRKKLTGKFLRL